MCQESIPTGNNIVNLLPFLIAAFFLINPLLEFIFRKFDIQAEKIQFWVMVTSGTAWLLALVNFLIDPVPNIVDISPAGTEFLPRLTFFPDWISAALGLSAAGLIFITVLNRQENPQANTWLAGLGGACIIALQTNSAYTLGLTWTIVEIFHSYFSFRDRKIASNPRKYLPVVMMRLSAPSALILYSLTWNESGMALFGADLNNRTGLLLIVVGLLGFLGWFLSYQGTEDEKPKNFPGAAENWVPAMLGLKLIIRGGALIEAGTVLILIPLILSSLLLIFSLAGLLLDRSSGMWFITCGLMASLSAMISGAESALSWGLVMILPALVLWNRSSQPKSSILPLILAAIGVLPLPYLPSWAGVLTFSLGIPGIILGVSYGILLGSLLITILKNWRSSEPDLTSLPLLRIIGVAAILISQAVISLRIDLISASQDLLSKPVMIWFSFLGLLPVLVLGNYLPLSKRTGLYAAGSRLIVGIERILAIIIHFMDRLVGLISRMFEGQGGLIWALLIGLLLMTLISAGGG